MEIGIGIPNRVRGTTGTQLLDWARRADAAGFSSLASIGAVSYPSYEELTVFAAAGAVTERIRFLSNVLIAPARSTAELAKQAATVHELTGGRLTLGVGAGWREADFRLTGRDFEGRGRVFDQQLGDLQRAWAGEPVLEGTRPAAPETGHGGVPLLIGGGTDAAIRRTVRFGIGWSAGGLPPQMVAPFLDRVRAAWQEAGRDGSPRFVALNYFSLGNTEQASRSSAGLLPADGQRDRRDDRRQRAPVAGGDPGGDRGLRRDRGGRTGPRPHRPRPRAGGPARRGRPVAAASAGGGAP